MSMTLSTYACHEEVHIVLALIGRTKSDIVLYTQQPSDTYAHARTARKNYEKMTNYRAALACNMGCSVHAHD